MTATVRILLNVTPGGFTLEQSIVEALFERSPQYFDEPLPRAEFGECSALPHAQAWPNSVVRGEDIHFLLTGQETTLRSDPWLLAQFDALGQALRGYYCGELRAVAVPADVAWTLYEEDCGIETIHEVHRVWG